jgi:hypothetical protein
MPPVGVANGRNEVEEVAWLPLEEAIAALTYPRDVEVVLSLASSSKGSVEVVRQCVPQFSRTRRPR